MVADSCLLLCGGWGLGSYFMVLAACALFTWVCGFLFIVGNMIVLCRGLCIGVCFCGEVRALSLGLCSCVGSDARWFVCDLILVGVCTWALVWLCAFKECLGFVVVWVIRLRG